MACSSSPRASRSGVTRTTSPPITSAASARRERAQVAAASAQAIVNIQIGASSVKETIGSNGEVSPPYG